jgi:hypothetical protein
MKRFAVSTSELQKAQTERTNEWMPWFYFVDSLPDDIRKEIAYKALRKFGSDSLELLRAAGVECWTDFMQQWQQPVDTIRAKSLALNYHALRTG